MAHIHCRDDQGRAAMVFEKFEETVRLIRAKKDCDIILNLTTSGGVNLKEEDRIRPFYELSPEMASFDCGTMNWQHTTVFENNPKFLEKLAALMNEKGVKPEIEVFDPGMIYNAAYLAKKGPAQAALPLPVLHGRGRRNKGFRQKPGLYEGNYGGGRAGLNLVRLWRRRGGNGDTVCGHRHGR